MQNHFHFKKTLLGAFTALLFMACQSSTSTTVSTPYPFELEDFERELFYDKFVGSNKALSSKNPEDDSLLWNDCYEFKAPPAVSLNDFVEHDWRSSVFKHRASGNNGVQDVYFPTMISNNTAYITKGYFILRYDITDNLLDLKKNNGGQYVYDNWAPPIDSDPISRIRSTLSEFMDRDGTLAGQTVFQIVYFQMNQNSIKGGELEEVEFIFGHKLRFEKTSELPTNDPEALRKAYERIANGDANYEGLVEETRYQIANLDGFKVTYRRTTADFNPNNSIPEFQDNPTKTCPPSF